MCEMWSDFRDAGFTYFSCAIVIIWACIAVIEKCTLQLLNISHGNHNWGLIWAWLIFVVQMIATVSWFVVADAQFTGDCEVTDDFDKSEFCPLGGAYLAIFLCVLTFAVPVIATYAFSKMQKVPYNYLRRKVFCLNQRGYLFILLIYLVFNLTIMAVILGSRNWIERDEEPKLNGSLFTFEDWRRYERYGYDCVEVTVCEQDSDLGDCELGEDLAQAGRCYLGLELMALFCIALWIQGVFIGALKATYYGHVIPNMVYAAGTWLFHTLAVITYLSYSDVEFKKETVESYDDDERLDVFARSSPNMAIVLIISLLLGVIIFILPHVKEPVDKKRRKSRSVKIDEEEEEQLAVS